MNQSTKNSLEVHESFAPCTLWRRFLVMLYDFVAIVAVLLFAAALPLLAGLGNQTAGKDPLYTAYLVTVWFLYLGWCWNRGGMTLGMRAWQVRIVHDHGGRPGWPACLLRFMLSLLSGACLGLGFVWSLFEPQKRCWHDMGSRTRLIHILKK